MWRKRDLASVNPDVYVPGNLTGGQFFMQVRPVGLSKKLFIDIGNNKFFLGQSQEAIDYDVAQSNPAGTTKDELFLEVEAELWNFPTEQKWTWDILWINPAGVESRPLGGSFVLTNNVTRQENGG